MSQISADIAVSSKAELNVSAPRTGRGISSLGTSPLARYLEKSLHTVFQISTSGALVTGVYDGVRLAMPLLAATAMATAHAGSGPPQPLAVAPMYPRADTCDVEEAKPPRPRPLEPGPLPVRPAEPVILDGVLYLDSGPRSGTAGTRRAALTASCSTGPFTWKSGVIDRRIDSPRYY
jgi:hypothetical protein